jgi:hypothetical protein
MPFFNRTDTYKQSKAIFAFSSPIEYTTSTYLTKEFISPDKNSKYEIAEGSFIASVGSKYRVLPRANVIEAAIATNSDTFKLSTPKVFVPGDILYVALPYTTITCVNTNAATITIDGRTITSTPTGAADAAEAAAIHADNVNSDPIFSLSIKAVAADDVIWFLVKDGKSAITITPGGAGTPGLGSTAASSTFNGTSIGTVARYDAINNNIVLTANAAVAVPVGIPVGAQFDKILGILDIGVDLTIYRPSVDYAVATEGYVYKNALPYYDESIHTWLPKIIVQEKF